MRSYGGASNGQMMGLKEDITNLDDIATAAGWQNAWFTIKPQKGKKVPTKRVYAVCNFSSDNSKNGITDMNNLFIIVILYRYVAYNINGNTSNMIYIYMQL